MIENFQFERVFLSEFLRLALLEFPSHFVNFSRALFC